MPKTGPNATYVTSFCNYAHRLRDGKPIGHQCYVLPTEALHAERDNDLDKATDILANWKNRRVHNGLKES